MHLESNMENNTTILSNLLHVSLFQFSPVWEDKTVNLNIIEKMLQSTRSETQLVVLPEMATTGFSMNAAALAETIEGDSIKQMKQWAAQYQVAICGSFIVQEMAAFYNRFIFFYPNGKIDTYDKKHLFTMGKEHCTYTAGSDRKLIDYLGWKILPVICYDLRFPVWCRNNLNYDLFICVANWPATRTFIWDTLLKARAIENQCFTIGCNRIEMDGNGIHYDGKSQILDAKSKVIATANEKEQILYAVLDKREQEKFRTAFPVLKDADGFQII